MREKIAQQDHKGTYRDEIKAEDLIIMGDLADDPAGYMPLDEGIYEGLWRLSLETDLGLVADIRRIPLAQSLIDSCNREDTDPYDQPMEGVLYIAHPSSGYYLKEDLCVIGYLTKDRKCLIRNKGRESYLGSRGREKETGHE